ncbi:MAG: hypothetical protein JXR91_04580, partial [Deltaproteobacteria bacterium]|nr:hypothetical protein [Deltaproteobacteria bacterium]
MNIQKYIRTAAAGLTIAAFSCAPAPPAKTAESKKSDVDSVDDISSAQAAEKKSIEKFESPSMEIIVPATYEENITLPVSARYTDKTDTYLYSELQTGNELDGLFTEYRQICYSSIINGQPSIAVVSLPDDTEPGKPLEFTAQNGKKNSTPEKEISFLPRLVVRVPGTKPLPEKIELELWGCGDLYDKPPKETHIQKITLLNMPAAKSNKKIVSIFYLGLAKWFNLLDYNEEFSNFSTFAEGRLMQLAYGENNKIDTPMERWHSGDNDIARLMDFYTGQSSVKAALATSSALGDIEKDEKETVLLKSIEGVDHQTRNYKSLLLQAGNPQTVMDPISMYLPSDSIVATFTTLKEFAVITSTLDEKFGLLARIVEGAPGPFHLKSRYGAQLALKFSGMAKLLGNISASSTALVIGDPYMREGTDVSLVFKNKNRDLLLSALQQHLDTAGDENGGIVEEKFKIEGFETTLYTSPNGVIKRYQVNPDEITIVSNSKNAVKKLLSIYKKKHPSLSQSEDYKYARALVPYDETKESAFIFLGDELVQSVTSPGAKILESRRMRAGAKLQNVNYAALLFGWMEGHPAASLDELLKSKWLLPSDLIHSGGEKISWTPELGAKSSYGTAHNLVPIADLPINRVTKSEKAAYDIFKQSYDRYWAGNIDPTLIRMHNNTAENKIDVRINILPIAMRSELFEMYNELTRAIGHGAIVDTNNENGFTMAMALGDDSELKEQAGQMLQKLSGKHIKMNFLGNWIKVGVMDTSDIWSSIAQTYLKGMKTEDYIDSNDMEIDMLHQLPRIPAWFSMEIGNPLTFAGVLTIFRAQAIQALPNMLTWTSDEPYGETMITKVTIDMSQEIEDAGTVNLFYTVINGIFIVTPRRDVLENSIDNAIARNFPTVSEDKKTGSQMVSTLAPSPSVNGWIDNSCLLALNILAEETYSKSKTGYEILTKGLGSNLSKKQIREWGINYLGYEPESPLGGSFSTDSEGIISHSIYGTANRHVIPDPVKGTPELAGAVR